MVLGISASGRADGITREAVMAVLDATGEETRFVSLSGLAINGCTACLGCAGDNVCKQEDDWNQIGRDMLEADAIVFGAPDYYGTINGLGHACLERTFSFRHQERFLLAGKLGVSIQVDGRTGNTVSSFIEMMMGSNKMAVVGTLGAAGFSQCYTCGYGEHCAVGGVVSRHGYLDKIEESHLPPRFCAQAEAGERALKAGRILGSIVRARRGQLGLAG